MKAYVVFLLYFFLCSSGVAKEKVTLAVPEKDDLSLVAIKVLKVAYKKIGVKLIFKQYPGGRVSTQSNYGLTDGEIVRVKGYNHKYKNLRIIPVPIVSAEIVAVTKSSFPKITTFSDLSDYTIGIRRGLKALEDSTVGLRVEKVNNYKNILDKVVLRRNDVGLLLKISAEKLIKKYNIIGLKIHRPPLTIFPLFHYLHKKRHKLIPRLTTTLREMTSSGELQSILKANAYKLLPPS